MTTQQPITSAPIHQFNHKKYRPFSVIKKANRRWPDKTIEQAPQWCSVDLRDGNQALMEPMNAEQKLAMFNLLVDVGFKEIEVGFPSASLPDFNFVRQLIEENLIPDDVTIQVLVQARESLIARTFEALQGAQKAIVHVYNSTSVVQREQVFKKSKEEIKGIAVQGAHWLNQYAAKQPETQWQFQYSPESFTGTEIDYAVEVINAVTAVWQTPEQAQQPLVTDKKVIINLPATVEMSTPNVYADQIETICENIARRDNIIISLHTHNDRGCGVAAAELGVMAGADRIEGTLLGNGERTGNMDIVTMAMNLYSQGIDPTLNFNNMDRIINVVEQCTKLAVHPRHPYAGELVFAAFSGSHQDAINKCLALDKEKRQADQNAHWNVAYLPIDPQDLGRDYQQVIRINSQSGKGGIAYILEQHYELKLPRWLQIDFSSHVQHLSETSETEVSAAQIFKLFNSTYLTEHNIINSYRLTRHDEIDHLAVQLTSNAEQTKQVVELNGAGNGVLSAFIQSMNTYFQKDIILVDYFEHTLGSNEKAEAICYVQINIAGKRICGVGKNNDILQASMQAILNAINND